MKIFIVETQDLVNMHRLHSSMEQQFVTTNYTEAAQVFEKECEQLAKEDQRAKYPDFDFAKHDPTGCVYCIIYALGGAGDDLNDGPVSFKSSDHFYIPQ